MAESVRNSNSRKGFPGSSFTYTPLEHVRTVTIAFIQGLFNGAPLGDYHWDPEDEKTEIIIRDENPIHVDKYGQRPCINFTMGTSEFYHMGMDDMLEYDFASGKKVKGMLVPGTITANVCARSDIEAHNLAWIVAEHVWLLRELLIAQGFFEIGRGMRITPPSPPGSIVASDSADGWYASSVSIPWQFARKSAFTPLGQQIVRNICEFVSAVSPKHVESQGWPENNLDHERPISVQECPPESFAPGASDARGGTPDPGGVKSNPLPKVPHPLNPAKLVTVRLVRGNRSGLRRASGGGAPALPIDARCDIESKSAK